MVGLALIVTNITTANAEKGTKMAKNEDKMTLAVGLMSGTSCDGVDAALIETDGEELFRSIATAFRPYSEEEQVLLKQALEDARGLKDKHARPGRLGEAEGDDHGALMEKRLPLYWRERMPEG